MALGYMESFLFNEMNRTTRDKNLEKIKLYRPFASALSFIIHHGNKSFSDLSNHLSVYRGLQLSEEELVQKYQIGK